MPSTTSVVTVAARPRARERRFLLAGPGWLWEGPRGRDREPACGKPSARKGMLGPRCSAGLMRWFCIGQQDVGVDHWSVRGISPRASLTVTVCGLAVRRRSYRSLNISSQCVDTGRKNHHSPDQGPGPSLAPHR
ncbi:hypothetical protein MUG91_G182n36 [Manis pentadactyla]|nr:hypothetical protein MUG91_G182n36 [Manis pentadactyla]